MPSSVVEEEVVAGTLATVEMNRSGHLLDSVLYRLDST